MSNPEAFLSGLLFFLWAWRIGSFLYSSYSVSKSLTPSYVGTAGKLVVTLLLMASSLALDLLPLAESPRLSLVNRIMSIPSQLNTMYFMHYYVACTLDSRRFTAFICLVNLASIAETAYMIHADWNRIE